MVLQELFTNSKIIHNILDRFKKKKRRKEGREGGREEKKERKKDRKKERKKERKYVHHLFLCSRDVSTVSFCLYSTQILEKQVHSIRKNSHIISIVFFMESSFLPPQKGFFFFL